MAQKNQQHLNDWQTVLHDFTDSLVPQPQINHHSLIPHTIAPPELSDDIFPHCLSSFSLTKNSDHLYPLEEASNDCPAYGNNKKRQYPIFAEPFSQPNHTYTLFVPIKQQSDFIYQPLSTKMWKQKKQLNQRIYSKNYRQKKKSQLKVLEEQNSYLRQKIDQLQLRIQSTQSELNKLKQSFQQKDKSITSLNQTWLCKIQQLLNSKARTEQDLYKEFAASYDEFGFAGKQKIQKLHYHMDEFLQNVLKDSQKYMALTVIDNIGLLGRSPDQDYSEINCTIFQIMEYDQHKLETVKKFLSPYLKPSMQKIQQSCQKLYQNFQQVFTQIYQSHEYLKASKNKDFLTIKQRLQMENWFQENKYSKELRKLRSDWRKSIQNKEDPNGFEFIKKKINSQNK